MIVNLNQLKIEDRSKFGGKAAALGELIGAGFNVPQGFAISTDDEIDKSEVYKFFDSLNSVNVAVRSSATLEDGKSHSFAGQFDSFMFVSRENLIEKIQECRESVNSERIKAYCEMKNINWNGLKIGVVVQKMIDSEYAAVAFSKNPVTGNDEVIIELVKGQGEQLVSGQATPASYIVKDENVFLENPSNSENIPRELVLEIAELIKKIKSYFAHEVDVEFAIEKDQIYILQSRPVTT